MQTIQQTNVKLQGEYRRQTSDTIDWCLAITGVLLCVATVVLWVVQ